MHSDSLGWDLGQRGTCKLANGTNDDRGKSMAWLVGIVRVFSTRISNVALNVNVCGSDHSCHCVLILHCEYNYSIIIAYCS